ncbi:MAG TPA: hypothetical protein VH853_02650 [Polyangia bacterium]|jgi:hypothetical protein|nr:hypothetical protein [Polyangia bacterium]
MLAAASLLGAASGCETVDLGAPPADVNVCEPGQQYFVSTIWPMFLGQTYNGKHCFDSTCHGSGTRTPMTLTDITMSIAGLPMPPPNPLPPDILNDYTQASQQMNCSDVPDSKLLIFPENIQIHGGGQLIDPASQQAKDTLTALEAWVASP